MLSTSASWAATRAASAIAGRSTRLIVGGARVDDARGVLPQRERGAEFVVVLVSDGFDGVPWLERVYQAASLWDAAEMGAQADVHCYTPAEFERKREALPVVALGRRARLRPARRLSRRR